MEDKDLIFQIQKLKDVKPAETWEGSLRTHLLKRTAEAGESRFASILSIMAAGFRAMERPAVVLPVLSLLVGSGIAWHQSRNSLPGDALYTLKSATERVQLSLSGEDGRVLYSLSLAQRRLEDLKRAAEENRVKNLSPAIFAFEESMGEASEEVARLSREEPSKALQAGRGLVELQNGKSQVEEMLGTRIGGEGSGELDELMSALAARELESLADRTLTEDQQEMYERAKTAFEEARYADALELIWELQQDHREEEDI